MRIRAFRMRVRERHFAQPFTITQDVNSRQKHEALAPRYIAPRRISQEFSVHVRREPPIKRLGTVKAELIDQKSVTQVHAIKHGDRPVWFDLKMWECDMAWDQRFCATYRLSWLPAHSIF